VINLRNMLKYAVAASLLQFGAVTHAADSLDALLKEVQSGRGAEQQKESDQDFKSTCLHG